MARLVIIAAAAWASFACCARAQTDGDLQVLWAKGDFAGMQEIAQTGDARAEAWMGLLLQNRGRRNEAIEWFVKAAEKNNAFALGSLSSMLWQDKKYDESIKWYRIGAEVGLAEMQARYATILNDGLHIKADKAEAFRWFKAAAAQGNQDSMLPLARLYMVGAGVEPNLEEAFVYASLALRRAPDSDTGWKKEADTLVREITQQVNVEQLKRARTLLAKRTSEMKRP